MSEPLSISTRQGSGAVTVFLAGELDIATVPDLTAPVMRCLSNPFIEDVVIDISRLDFIDSTGIGCLIECKNRSVDVRKRLVVNGSHGRVATVLDLSGVTEYLTDGHGWGHPTAS